MKIVNSIMFVIFIFTIFSCKNKNIDKNIIGEINKNEYYQKFEQKNTNKVQMVYTIDYYINKIEKYQDDYYKFNNISMYITELMNITSIMEVDNVVPGLLTFLVSWINPKGNIYYLYIFDENQNITDDYFCGQIALLNDQKQILMKKIGGKILDNEVISTGDFNNDGINEIILYTQYQNIGYVFCVLSFNALENNFEEICLVPVFLDFDNTFSPVEYTGNGFKILEVIESAPLELAWNTYIWDNNKMKYVKQ